MKRFGGMKLLLWYSRYETFWGPAGPRRLEALWACWLRPSRPSGAQAGTSGPLKVRPAISGIFGFLGIFVYYFFGIFGIFGILGIFVVVVVVVFLLLFFFFGFGFGSPPCWRNFFLACVKISILLPSSYKCSFTLPLALWQGLIAVTKKERPKYIGQLRRLGTQPKQKQTLIHFVQG